MDFHPGCLVGRWARTAGCVAAVVTAVAPSDALQLVSYRLLVAVVVVDAAAAAAFQLFPWGLPIASAGVVVAAAAL